MNDFEYKGLVIAFVAALAWNFQGNPGGKTVGDYLADDIETAFARMRLTLKSKSVWLEAEELRALAFAQAKQLAETSIDFNKMHSWSAA